jgi:hypothetical protein
MKRELKNIGALGLLGRGDPGRRLEMIESTKLNAIANSHSIIKYPLLKLYNQS